ncbi:MAG: hypothetical protein NMNS01_19890 [Nitrosomonas sp.]|jgi:hypothetical protein|nr:MAG: hypothetical protein NMNS01_19890 [Nitrosomonas sp.]
MASTNQVFISFALKDADLKDKLVEQINKARPEVKCVDMPMKKSWESAWKAEVQDTVRGCVGVIGLISESITRADGQQWELRCAFDSGLPVMLICDSDSKDIPAKELPDMLREKDIRLWEEPTVTGFLNGLNIARAEE